MTISHCLWYCSLAEHFEIGKCESSEFFLFKDSFGYSASFAFLCEISDQLFNLCVEASWDFHRAFPESLDQFGDFCLLNSIKSTYPLDVLPFNAFLH